MTLWSQPYARPGGDPAAVPPGHNGPMTSANDLDRKVLAAVERLGRALRAARQQAATRHGLSLLGVSVLETLAESAFAPTSAIWP